MINIQQVLCTNGAAIILLLLVLQSSLKVFNQQLLDHRIMNQMIIIAITGCALDSVAYLINGVQGYEAYIILKFVSMLEYMTNSLFSYVWMVYADYKLFGDINRLKHRYMILTIPATFIILLSFVNFFTPIFFSVNRLTNTYARTELYYIPNIVVFFYITYGAILIYRYRNKVGKYLFLPVIIFMIPVFMGVILDYFSYGIALKQIGVAIGLTSLYMNVQKEISCIEPLSGLRTRQYMINSLTREIKFSTSDKGVAGILLDIDKFKSINDTYGHLAGDEAIRTFGVILRSTVFKNDMVIRFAGDEFVIIHKFSEESEINELIALIEEATKKLNDSHTKQFTIHFSAGYTILDKKTDTIDSFLDRMDHAMYIQKREKS